MSTRIAVVGDDPLARAGIVALLQAREDLRLVGQGAPREAGRLARDADVVVWDVGPAPLHLDEEMLVLALVADEEQAAQALADGARGVLARDAAADRVGLALSAVRAGLVVVDHSFAHGLLAPAGPKPALVEPLTPREREVLALLGQGLSNRAIADRLAVSESTAKFHVAAILGKLGVRSRAEAVAQAFRLGLVVL